ncbi:hypothetical protein CR513_27084, partial [Mucuna pruriens]
MHGSDKNQDTSLDLNDNPFSTHITTFNDGNEVDDVHATCYDPIEGLQKNICFLEAFLASFLLSIQLLVKVKKVHELILPDVGT